MSEPALETKSSDSSAATSDDYEMVAANADSEAKMEGNEADVCKEMSRCLDDSPVENNGMANENRSLEDEDDEEDGDGRRHTVFHNIRYLGFSGIGKPKNETAIHTIIREMNVLLDLDEEECSGPPAVTVSVPRTSDGTVYVRQSGGDDHQRRLLAKFAIHRIIFFARGSSGSPDQSCFAFTCATDKNGFTCHVFRCSVAEAVTKVFVSFAQAFKKSPTDVDEQAVGKVEESFLFEVALEVKEREANSGTYEVVPRQKGLFKLRSNVDKMVVVTVQQVSKNNTVQLGVERCFGMLVSPGPNVRHADMQLLERVTMATTVASEDGGQQDIVHVITGHWDPRETSFAVLNKETPADVTSVYLTIAADLVMTQVAEPVRFVVETKARILPQNERYWYYAKKGLVKHFSLRLGKGDGGKFQVLGIDKSEEIESTSSRSSRMSLTLQMAANLTASTLSSIRSPPEEDLCPLEAPNEDEDDNDEPLLSGFGAVSKDWSGSELDAWKAVLSEWDRDKPRVFPKALAGLIRSGVPEALRCEVWQRVTGASVLQEEVVEAYRVLITKESPDEKVILRDIHRTFPAHEFFKEAGGGGQESLYRIAKAYSVYDSEIGYCQGQSFLIAALLLQMPEEQAFGVLVRVMHDLGLRDMFRENFEQLQLRLHQLDRLVEAHMPDLAAHFTSCGLESHMFASQWFLTVFTAKFPLFLVFRVLDVFLLEGFEAVFKVALAILKVAKKELLQQDFEGLMKHFRVNIPKTYRSEDNAKHLMAVASGLKLRRMAKYEKEWLAIKEAERAREDPVARLERENKKLLADNLRLDTENDSLARELVNSKIEMRRHIDAAEDAKDLAEKDLEVNKQLMCEANEEKKRLQGETEQLKAVLKREVDKLDSEVASKNQVVQEYKIICSQLSEKLEKAQKNTSNTVKEEEEEEEEEENVDGEKKRIRELEMELAQTKLALVEAKCRNQELGHQLSAVMSHEEQQQQQQQQQQQKNTWFSKTLSSIKETAVMATTASATAYPNEKQNRIITKSSSVEGLRSVPD